MAGAQAEYPNGKISGYIKLYIDGVTTGKLIIAKGRQVAHLELNAEEIETNKRKREIDCLVYHDVRESVRKSTGVKRVSQKRIREYLELKYGDNVL